ncbi:coenzyme F420-0:L-glutamate ligase [Geodermatophilus sp. SYSU D00758]
MSEDRPPPEARPEPARAEEEGVLLLPVRGLPEFAPGDDLAAAVAGAAPWLADGDVVVVTSKVVSKVEGRLVRVEPGTDREVARQRAVEAETVRVVARRGPLRIVETRHGWVVAAAGIDASNVAGDALVLLPEDADASARALRERLRALLGVQVAVVVSDTFGRTWREGLTDVAVGSAGIAALTDHRGDVDAHGNRLETTQVAVVDELAAAADLVKGKLAGVPVAVVRGLAFDPPAEDAGTRPLVRLGPGDLFPYGSRDLVGSRAPGADLVPRPGELDAVAEAFRVAVAALPEFPVVVRYGGEGDGVVDVHLQERATTTTALNLGALLGAVVVQLHAEGWTTRWEPVGTPGGSSLVGRLWLGSPPT